MVQTVPNNISVNNRQYMTQDQFCFWLQGLFELCPDLKCLTETQVKMIRDHLSYVFNGKDISTTSVVPPTTTVCKEFYEPKC
jgi:hypothetical protein